MVTYRVTVSSEEYCGKYWYPNLSPHSLQKSLQYRYRTWLNWILHCQMFSDVSADVGDHNSWIYWLHCFSIQESYDKCSADGNDQLREDGSFLFKVIVEVLIIYIYVQVVSLFKKYIKVFPHISQEPPILLLQCVPPDAAALVAVSQLPCLECQQIQSTAFFSSRLSDLVGIFPPFPLLCLDFFPVVPLPLFFSLQTSSMLFFSVLIAGTPTFLWF